MTNQSPRLPEKKLKGRGKEKEKLYCFTFISSPMLFIWSEWRSEVEMRRGEPAGFSISDITLGLNAGFLTGCHLGFWDLSPGNPYFFGSE